MHNAPINVTETDFLIIGGGTGGPMAAIIAKQNNPEMDVLIVDKATVKRGGSICRGMDAYNNVTVPGKATVDEYEESVNIISEGIYHKKANRVLAERSFETLRNLENWGAASFPKDEKGEYIVQPYHTAGSFTTEMRGDIKPAMAKKCKDLGVRKMDRTIATKILTHEGRATGAVLLNVRTGEKTVCKAKTILMACGSQGRFSLPHTGFLFGTFDCPFNAGDGYSMLLDAGADLVHMEYNLVAPLLKDYEGPGHSTFIRYGAYMVNGLGERFLTKYHPKGENCPEGYRMKGMMTEISEGRGPIYYDIRHLGDEKIQAIKECLFYNERPTEQKFFEQKGIDIAKDLIEVSMVGPKLCGGHGLSGVLINEKAETNIENLYACGDVASTCVGFVGSAWVFGMVSAEETAKRLSDIPEPVVDLQEAEAEYERLFAPLLREEGLDAEDVEYKIRNRIRPNIASPRHASKMTKALEEIDRFRNDVNEIKVDDLHGVMKAYEIGCILESYEMALAACIEREESRWGFIHYRPDFPETDENPYWVVVNKGEDGHAVTSRKPVSDQ